MVDLLDYFEMKYLYSSDVCSFGRIIHTFCTSFVIVFILVCNYILTLIPLIFSTLILGVLNYSAQRQQKYINTLHILIASKFKHNICINNNTYQGRIQE